MDDSTRSSVLIVTALILAAMYFAVCETAFASVPKARIRARAEKDERSAVNALYVIEHFDRAITTLLICTNIVHLAAASVTTVMVTRIWGLSAVSISTIVMTLVVFFFGEMLPKSFARKYSERCSLAVAGMLRFLMMILRPFSALLSSIGNMASRFFSEEAEVSVTENELYDIIEDMTEDGTLDEEQGDLISSALQFQDVTVGSILTSRVDVAAIDIDMTQEEILALIKRENHSRMPVYQDNIDTVIGILQIRKYIRKYINDGCVDDLRALLDEPFFVHQSAKVNDVLTVMSKAKMNVAIVTDNFGGTLGIVSVEDILEELVGEIWDEDDQVDEPIIRLSDDSYSISAEEPVLGVFDELGLKYSEEEEEELTNKLMSELAYESFARIPKEGDRFTSHGAEISVLSMKQNRIIRLLVQVFPQDPQENIGRKMA
ncbi:MAG: HlyC/CorC family transporter [Solobacterium sp.]|nr:HlyC/CorC family transporter [Solobacterium sp.]MBQ1446390.1 HlyC/CorC family transporter [Solobacterium sp.]MBQ2690507.1 HlyC/CorC family transporter [Solobacterium sp.]MBR0477537.1 HlyC/CorC family transporter [Solobacterium sp.]